AEDGIRDSSVTGVQTCALPIYNRERQGQRRKTANQIRRIPAEENRGRLIGNLFQGLRLDQRELRIHFLQGGAGGPDERIGLATRSEERRVGEECRCGGVGARLM